MNVIDFLAIAPFYVDIFFANPAVPSTFLRVLRLMRIFRMLVFLFPQDIEMI
jgi:hypothetical protein